MDVQQKIDNVNSPSLAESEENPGEILELEEICSQYADRVRNVARRMLSSDVDAEDVTQEVLLQVVRKLDTFRGEAAIATWLHRVTVNAALAHRRSKALRDRKIVQGAENNVLEEGHCPRFERSDRLPPDEELAEREKILLIQQAIAQLPCGYREVFELSEIEGLPNAEIGEQLGLSLAAVKSRLHRARQMMKKALTPHLDAVLV